MDRGRYRAILNALGLGGVGLLVVTGPLLAQTPTPTPRHSAPGSRDGNPVGAGVATVYPFAARQTAERDDPGG